MFTYRLPVRLFHTDAGQRLFYGHLFALVQEAFEEFMHAQGNNVADVWQQERILLPVVHIEADYRLPLRFGDVVSVTVQTVHLGTTSFRLQYEFRKEQSIAARATTVQVSVDADTGHKITLPASLRQALSE